MAKTWVLNPVAGTRTTLALYTGVLELVNGPTFPTTQSQHAKANVAMAKSAMDQPMSIGSTSIVASTRLFGTRTPKSGNYATSTCVTTNSSRTTMAKKSMDVLANGSQSQIQTE